MSKLSLTLPHLIFAALCLFILSPRFLMAFLLSKFRGKSHIGDPIASMRALRYDKPFSSSAADLV